MHRAVAYVCVLLLAGCTDAARFEDEVRDVPVPHGVVFVFSSHTSSGTPRANALYEAPEASDAETLLDEVAATIEIGGWQVRIREFEEAETLGGPDVPRGYLRATREARFLDVDVSRWTTDYGGCCVFTDDPSRPLGIYLTLFEDTANTR